MRHKSTLSVVSISVTNLLRRILAALALGVLALIGAGCMSDQIDATNKLVQQQQEQIEHQQQELEQLQASQNQGYTPGAATASAQGGCDEEEETIARQRGGDHIDATQFNHAVR